LDPVLGTSSIAHATLNPATKRIKEEGFAQSSLLVKAHRFLVYINFRRKRAVTMMAEGASHRLTTTLLRDHQAKATELLNQVIAFETVCGDRRQRDSDSGWGLKAHIVRKARRPRVGRAPHLRLSAEGHTDRPPDRF